MDTTTHLLWLLLTVQDNMDHGVINSQSHMMVCILLFVIKLLIFVLMIAYSSWCCNEIDSTVVSNKHYGFLAGIAIT